MELVTTEEGRASSPSPNSSPFPSPTGDTINLGLGNSHSLPPPEWGRGIGASLLLSSQNRWHYFSPRREPLPLSPLPHSQYHQDRRDSRDRMERRRMQRRLGLGRGRRPLGKGRFGFWASSSFPSLSFPLSSVSTTGNGPGEAPFSLGPRSRPLSSFRHGVGIGIGRSGFSP